MKRGFLISVGAYLGLWLVLEALFPAPSYAYLDLQHSAASMYARGLRES